MDESGEARRAGRGPWAWRGVALMCGLAYAGLSALSFPPLNLWGLSLIAVAPLAWVAAAGRARPSSLGLWAAVGSAPLWALTHWWIIDVSAVGLFPLVLYLSVYPGLFVWLGARLARRRPGVAMVFVTPVLWGGVEFLRARVAFSGYPWYLVGHPLIGVGWLGWAGAYIGATGVSVLACVPSGIVADVARRRVGAAQAVGVAALALWAGLGVVSAHEPARSGTARVAVVQTNVAQDNKLGWAPSDRVEDFDRFLELTREALDREPPPDLIVWPETMAPGDTLDAASVAAEKDAQLVWILDPARGQPDAIESTMVTEMLLLFQRRGGVPMLVGATGYEGLSVVFDDDGAVRFDADGVYNSAFVIDGGRVQDGWYRKVHLTPFGEVMPYISAWPWLERRLLAVGASGMSFDLDAGVDQGPVFVPTSEGGLAVATPICFEATMPAVCRSLVFDGGSRRAGLMVNLTNDGWFGDWTPGRRAHMLAARWRCVELGTPMVRAANTGVSAVIDGRGRVVRDRLDDGRAADRVDGVLTETVALADGATVYARTGELAGWLVLGGSGVVIALGLVGAGRGRASKPRGGDGR